MEMKERHLAPKENLNTEIITEKNLRLLEERAISEITIKFSNIIIIQ